MAELTTLDDKIGEVIGLAMASKDATAKIAGLVEDPHVRKDVERMHDDAVRLERLGTELLGNYDGKKTAILEKARETRAEGNDMMKTYLGDDADGLDGLEFLTMAEAGEVGHWNVVNTLNHKAGDRDLQELIDLALPMQEAHLQLTLKGAIALAGEEDPNAPA